MKTIYRFHNEIWKKLNYSGILSNKISMGKKCICNISMVDSYIQEHLEVDN